jgi:tRNA G26 N,N-dimethylase Trm1
MNISFQQNSFPNINIVPASQEKEQKRAALDGLGLGVGISSVTAIKLYKEHGNKLKEISAKNDITKEAKELLKKNINKSCRWNAVFYIGVAAILGFITYKLRFLDLILRESKVSQQKNS